MDARPRRLTDDEDPRRRTRLQYRPWAEGQVRRARTAAPHCKQQIVERLADFDKRVHNGIDWFQARFLASTRFRD
jgi:hypothetical protein